MKVKVKATGEYIEVKAKAITSPVTGKSVLKYVNQKTGISYFEEELFFPTDVADDPYYWTRLEHQYAGMALTGICANPIYDKVSYDIMADDAIRSAKALVEKLKEKEEK